MKKLLISLCCTLLVVACSGNGTAETTGGTLPVQGAAAVAQRVVGGHTGRNYKEVVVISVEVVDFSDSSLGCPQPGMAYLQVITPGHKVVAEVSSGSASKQKFDVRVAGGHGFICTPSDRNKTTR
jgi:hypothetical protein